MEQLTQFVLLNLDGHFKTVWDAHGCPEGERVLFGVFLQRLLLQMYSRKLPLSLFFVTGGFRVN